MYLQTYNYKAPVIFSKIKNNFDRNEVIFFSPDSNTSLESKEKKNNQVPVGNNLMTISVIHKSKSRSKNSKLPDTADPYA